MNADEKRSLSDLSFHVLNILLQKNAEIIASTKKAIESPAVI